MLNRSLPHFGFFATLTSLGLVLSFLATPLPAEDEDLPLNFGAVAVNMSNVGSRGQTRVDIGVNRWSSDEERATLMEALKAGGRRTLPDALRKQEVVGRIREVGELSEVLFYSRRIPTEDGQVIRLATDRPVGFAEVMRGTRTRDYNVTVVQLTLDAEGAGEGVIMMGSELSWDEEKNQIVIEHFASQPIRLTSVKRKK